MLEVIVGIIDIVVTMISIIVTVISIIQTEKNIDIKKATAPTKVKLLF